VVKGSPSARAATKGWRAAVQFRFSRTAGQVTREGRRRFHPLVRAPGRRKRQARDGLPEIILN
jgi:hypothetical protein